MNGSINESKLKSLNIKSSENTILYNLHLKHNTYVSPLSCSLPEKLTDELHEGKDLSLQKININVTLPEIVSQPFAWSAQPDPSSQLVRETTEYNKFVKTCKTLDKKNKNRITLSKIRENVGKTIELPSYMAELATRRPPSTFFEGNYDYRFTGGTISMVHFNHNHLLMSAKQNHLIFNCLKSGKEVVYEEKSQIFNIQGYNFSNSAYVTVRFAHDVQIHKLKSHEPVTVSLKPLYISKPCAKLPLIDLKMMSRKKVVTANVAQQVQLIDLHEKKEIYSKTIIATSSYDLCQVAPVDEEVFLFMNRSRVQLVDPRTSLEAHNILKFGEGYFSCNALCTLCLSAVDSNYFYVASKHSVYKCDSRLMQIVKKWPHFLDHSPIAIKSLAGDEQEILFIASFYETVCLAVSTNANYMPFKVPSIRDAFDYYNLYRNIILDLDMKHRWELSTIGIDVSSAKGKHYLYTTNSIGDIFRQRITHKYEDDSKAAMNLREMDAMQEFISKLPTQETPLKITHQKNLSGLSKAIIGNESKLCENDLRLGSYLQPNKTLHQFLHPEKKFARYDMAAIWNTERVNILMDGEKTESDSLVGKWLQDNTNEYVEDDPS